MQVPLRARQADIGEAALLLQPGAAALVHRPLVRKEPVFPAGQEDGLEFQPLCRMQRHDVDGIELGILLGVHDQRDMLQEGAQALILLHGADQLLQVLEPAGRFRRAVVLPHRGVAGFVQHDLGKLGVRRGFQQSLPAREIGGDLAKGGARLRLQLVALGKGGGSLEHRHAKRTRRVVDLADRGLAKPALGHVHDALEGEVVGALRHDAQKGERIADFHPLVEARTADDAVVQADLDEAVLEGARLEGRAHQDRHVVQLVLLPVQPLDLLADGARLLVGIPGGMHGDLGILRVGPVGEQRLAEAAFIVGDQVRGGAEYVGRGAIVAFQADDGGAREILVEAQDVVDLGAAPAVDRLVVVADAADVDGGGDARARCRSGARSTALRGRCRRRRRGGRCPAALLSAPF